MVGSSAPSILVAGAGIAGLTAAYTLQRSGFQVRLVEASSEVGGVIRSREARGFLMESGPHSFLASARNLVGLTTELGLHSQIIRALPAARRRYVYWNGALQPVPHSITSLVRSSLLSRRAKWYLLGEPCRPRGQDTQEAVAQFVRRRCGDEVLERLVAPFVSGVYGGDPEVLGVAEAFPKLWGWERRWGSLTLGAVLDALTGPKSPLASGSYTLRSGMGSLVRAIADHLPGSIFVNSLLLGAEPLTGGGFEARTVINGRAFQRRYDALVLATPAYAAAKLVESFAADAGTGLAGIPYAPLAVMATGYESAAIPVALDGFGYLVPRGQNLRILGTIWNSAIFSARAPAGMTLLTHFLGGAGDPLVLSLSDDQLLAVVRADLGRIMSIGAEPGFVQVVRHERAIPQYTQNHRACLAAVAEAEARFPGLVFTGSYRGGVSVDQTIMDAQHQAGKLAEYLKSRPIDPG